MYPLVVNWVAIGNVLGSSVRVLEGKKRILPHAQGLARSLGCKLD